MIPKIPCLLVRICLDPKHYSFEDTPAAEIVPPAVHGLARARMSTQFTSEAAFCSSYASPRHAPLSASYPLYPVPVNCHVQLRL